MATTQLEKVLQEVKNLTPDEQRRVRAMLDEMLPQDAPDAESDAETRAELDRRLMAAGLLLKIPSPEADQEARRNWRPVPVLGKPVSETIIEERR